LSDTKINIKPSSFYYSLIIWLGVFVPGHLGSFLLEQAFIAFAVMWAFFIFITKNTNSNYFGLSKFSVLAFFLILQLFYIFSYLHAEILFSKSDSGLRDYFELARYLIYMVFALFVFFYYPINSKNLAESLIRATLFFSLSISLIYIFKVPLLSGFFEDFLYAATRDDLSQISTGGRVRFTAPFPNPNYLAYFLCISLVYLLYFSSVKDRSLLILITLYLLFITGSRTGWLVAAFIFIFFQIAYIKHGLSKRGKFSSLVLVSFSSAAIVLLLSNNILPSVTRLSELIFAFESGNISSIESFAQRIEHNLFIWNSLKDSFIFGLGPSKYSLTTVIDNQYLMWITRQGIVGISIIFTGVLYLFIHMLRFSTNTLQKSGIIIFFIALLLFGMTGAFLNNFRLFLLTIFFAAVIIDNCKKFKKIN
tara:strand:- start:2755 stop:4017 length:1263 start_codon:yes stop_codon:yes gene_type:complete